MHHVLDNKVIRWLCLDLDAARWTRVLRVGVTAEAPGNFGLERSPVVGNEILTAKLRQEVPRDDPLQLIVGVCAEVLDKRLTEPVLDTTLAERVAAREAIEQNAAMKA